MSKKAIVLLAEGFEEIEAVTPVDYLRRAGVAVTVAAIGQTAAVTGARGVTISADMTLRAAMESSSSWDAVIIPGGMPGAANLAASDETAALLKKMSAGGKWICAICASPAVVLAPLGLLSGRRFTCYPGMEKQVSGAVWQDERVVVDAGSAAAGGGIITSRGAGTAGEFAIVIISRLLGKAEADRIAASVLL
jgi:4-methyl-5(b-hydroxyethyl)-thiazole monophosphate biosynthesis